MRNLTGWQVISFASRGVANVIGLVQTFIFVRILTVSEYGLVQLAAAVGGALGIYQHLGLASGSTREISSAKDDTEIFKIFFTSVVIRYMVTIPLTLWLFFYADNIAVGQYAQPALITPLKIYALVLPIQGLQSIFNSVIAGTKRFKQLFTYQAVIPLVSVFLYVILIYFYRIDGYFYAFFLFNLISTITLGYIAFRPLRGKLQMPSGSDFKRLLKELFSISLAIYAVKIVYTWWEKSGPLLLGFEVTPELVGIFTFAMLFSKKIIQVSDAVTDINLPVFSEKYVQNIEEFKSMFVENFNKVFAFILFAATSAIFWSHEIVYLFGGSKYDSAAPLILPLVFTFTFYAFINIIKSSIFIPAKLIKEMIFSFILMFGVTVSFYSLFTEANILERLAGAIGISAFERFVAGLPDISRVYALPQMDFLGGMTFGLLAGVLVGFAYMVFSSQYKLRLKYIDHSHVLLLIQSFIIAFTKDSVSFWFKFPLYAAFVALYVAGLYIAKFIDQSDVAMVRQKLGRFRR